MLTRERDLLTLEDVQVRLRVSRATVYRLIGEEGFPLPVKVGRSNRWLEIEVVGWLDGRQRADIAAGR